MQYITDEYTPKMQFLLLLWERVRVDLTLGQLEDLAQNGPQYISGWAHAEIERRWHIDDVVKHFFVAAKYSIYSSDGHYVCRHFFREFIEACSDVEAEYVFIQMVKDRIKKRHYIGARDVQLIQHGSPTIRRILRKEL